MFNDNDREDFDNASVVLSTSIFEDFIGDFDDMPLASSKPNQQYNSSLATNKDHGLGLESESEFRWVPIISAFAISIFVTIIDSLIIYVIVRYKKLRTASYTLMASISIFDMLHSAIGK